MPEGVGYSPEQAMTSVIQAKTPEEALDMLRRFGFALVPNEMAAGPTAPEEGSGEPGEPGGEEGPEGPMNMAQHRQAMVDRYGELDKERKAKSNENKETADAA